jgi:tetratricopeptide (TPR) repeat protein
LFSQRRELHQKIAGYYEKNYSKSLESYFPLLAYHYSFTENKDKKLYYFEKAGDAASKNYSNQEAIKYYTQAIEVVSDKEMRSANLEKLLDIYLKRGDIYTIIGSYNDAISDFQKVYKIARAEEIKLRKQKKNRKKKKR